MNASFQDCTVLNQLIGHYGNNWNKIFSKFSKKHIVNGHAIADMAIENYEEMRDAVNKSTYQAQRYSMVSFSERPYSEVYETGEKQYELLNKLLEADPTGETIDVAIVNKFFN